MKLSYKKIIIILSLLFFFLIANLFIFKIANYLLLLIPIVLTLTTLIYLVGYEKKHYDKEKDIILNLIIYIICYLITTYLLGLKTGFTTTSYSISPKNIVINILPVFLFVSISEILRYQVLRKGSKNKIIVVLITIILILLDLSTYINYFAIENSPLKILVLIPLISKHIFLTYLVIKVGLYPSITYRLIMELKNILLPIHPDFGIYIDSILNVLFPSLCFYFTYKFFNRKKDNKVRRKEKNELRNNIITTVIFSLVFIIVVLSSGLFKYSLFSIGSNSMEPTINKGDIIILKKVDNSNLNTLKKGDVIAFKNQSNIISHRIVKIKEESGIKYYYTKGDNNETIDKYPVVKEDIVGISKLRLKFLGWPSVILNELLNKR